jgi:type I restriction enzyme S subunit
MRKYPKYKDSGAIWVGNIPELWDAKRIKHITYVKGRIGWQGMRSDEFLDYSDSYVVTGTDFDNGRIKWETCHQVPIERYDEDPFIQLKNDDLLITKDGTIGKVALVKQLPKIATLNSGIFLTRPKDESYSNAFMYWILISDVFKTFYDFHKSGSTIQHLYQNVFNEFKFPIPPLPEQLQIVSYLDHKTTLIDQIISGSEKKIELLKEQRTATINHAVTKGLNPKAKVKDSGVEWIGEIPEGWEVISLKRLCKVKRGASPRPIDDEKYFDENGEYSWVRISDVSASKRYLTQTEQKLSELGSSLSVKMNPGDIFLSIAGSVGKPIITEIKCCIHDGFVWFEHLKYDKEFLYRIFDLGTCFLGLGKFGTQLNLNTDTIGSLSVPNIPLSEQQQIVSYLDQKTKEIDDLIASEKKRIELLKEYRQSLISEVVTGKIKVLNIE